MLFSFNNDELIQEYLLKDASVEKICAWLKNNFGETVSNPAGSRIFSKSFLLDHFANFRKVYEPQ